ncbi:60S acidic ribosomal protein P1-like isoform X2 [Hyaena hyaena]|uniref:60S acidic ribosomal protein P1-like isoform X2 n=1 Tax=Hyaena hyaena TaxID=95912 RepID=UPI00192168D7|nr:60S acidic ribosomal protein P1-like isoform X2 [Hyaena hyaena]
MAASSELACIYSALNLHHDEVTVTSLANVNIRSPICNVGGGGPVPAAGAVWLECPTPSTTAAPAGQKEVEAKKEESEEPDDDMGFGFFD